MLALKQSSVSRPPLLSASLVDTPLAPTDWPREVFSSPTNRTASRTASLPPAYDRQIVRPNAIEMNTCTKTGEGEGAFRDPVFVAATFRRADYEAFDLPKSMRIMLLHKNDEQLSWNHTLSKKNRGEGAPEALLELPSSGGLRECQHDLLARKTDVLSIARSDFDNPCQWDRGRRGDGRAFAPPACATPHAPRTR